MPRKLGQDAYRRIRADIISCVLPPSASVVQSELASRYCLGLTPVREALKRLEGERFVYAVPGSGYVVSPVTLAYVHAMFEFRGIVECAAVRLAALRATQDQLARIAELSDITYEYGNLESYIEYIGHNAQFHKAVAEASGNPRLAETNAQVLDEMARVFHLGLTVEDSTERLEHDHKSLVDALTSHDPDRAEETSKGEIDYALQRVRDSLNRLLSGSSRGWLSKVAVTLESRSVHTLTSGETQ